jgi:hypothetical protein
VTDREPDSTPTKYGDPPAASCAGSGLARGQQGGVASLRAVVDLTVKTNIRTARRGTLRGARTSPTMQAGLRGYQACEVLAVRKSYVGDAKLDKMLSRHTKGLALRERGYDCFGSLVRPALAYATAALSFDFRAHNRLLFFADPQILLEFTSTIQLTGIPLPRQLSLP